MKTLAEPRVVQDLVGRLERLAPEAERRWGTLTAAEMLCHLADCSRSLLAPGSRPTRAGTRGRPVLKWIALSAPIPWPKGRLRTRPEVDPRAGGSRPQRFETDRAGAIEGVRALATAAADAFPTWHFMFGPMTPADWRRWGYLHIDHHLRQFGL
jgi:hypothetical protein